MIEITRRKALQLRSILRRAFGSRGPGPALRFTVGPDGLSVKAGTADVAIEYLEPAVGPCRDTLVPLRVAGRLRGEERRAGTA